MWETVAAAAGGKIVDDLFEEVTIRLGRSLLMVLGYRRLCGMCMMIMITRRNMSYVIYLPGNSSNIRGFQMVCADATRWNVMFMWKVRSVVV